MHRGHRARLRVPQRRHDARLRPRHAHRDARRCGPTAAARSATTSPAGCCSCSSRARRATTAPGSCSRKGLLDVPKRVRRHAVTGHRGVRPAHHLVAAVRLVELPRRSDHGVGRHAAHHGHGPRRPRQRAVPGARPDPGRVRDRAGAADDGHPPIDVFDPAVVTVGQITAGTTNNIIPETAEIEGTIRAVSERHAARGARRHPPRRRRHRRGPRRRGRRSTSSTAIRSPSTTTRVRRRRARRSPTTSSAPTRSCACPTRSWAPRTSATSCSRCPGR